MKVQTPKKKFLCNSIAVLALTLITLAYLAVSFGKPEVSLTQLDYAQIEEKVEIISNFGSRMTGYPGYQKTLEFIYSYLQDELGLKVTTHTYKVLVPFEEEAYIEVLEPPYLRVKVHALYPNGVNPSTTPPEGLEGPLHYVGKGELSDFNGKNIEGSIVAMEFNSQDNWLNAAKLGAKAVIFIEPISTTYYECNKKFLDTPINFPRVYINKDDWKLVENASKIRLVSKITWKEIEAANLIAVINGSSASDILILAAHFDSWSVVPALSNSKAEAIAPAYLLELARYLKENKPRYTVWLVFLSGHWQALAGVRAFIEDYFFNEEILSGRTTIWGFIGFDMFSSDSDGIQLLQSSYFTTYGGNSIHSGGFPARLTWVSNKIQTILAEEPLRTYTNSVLGVPSPSALVSTFFSYQGFWGTEPIPYMLDSEAASISGVPSFSITSRHSSRLYVGMPVDDWQYANVSALKPYLEVTTYIVLELLNTEWQISKNSIKPTRYDLAADRGYPGFTTFYGRVVRYNFSAGWYSPVPNAIVETQLVTSTYKLNKIITRTDAEGRFVIYGIPHAGRVAGGGTAVPFSRWIARGWVFNEQGAIIMATDLGQFGMQNFAQIINVLHEYENLTVVVAPAVIIELFDVNLPSTLLTPSMPDPRTSYFGWWRQTSVIFQPYELLSKSLPLSYGYFCNGWENVALVWAQPETYFIVVGYTSMTGTAAALQPFLLLTNSSSENTEGYGFIGSPGKNIRVIFTAYRAANDMYYISSGRYKHFVDRHVGSPSADLTLSKAREHLDRAKEAFSATLYHEAYAHALVARAYASKAYSSEVMPLVNDAARSMLYMFPLIAFAAFFLEKISLHREGVKRIATMTVLAAVILWFFLMIHPAFAILSNIPLGLVGSLITIILLITVVMLGSEGEALRSRIERKILGVHRSEVSRVDTAVTAFSMGSEYIRKRPMRTVLMLATIIAMTIAITSFTSLMPARIT
ncbi:MAG: M28 family peptidase, partial [Thermofilaceae archaeon]